MKHYLGFFLPGDFAENFAAGSFCQKSTSRGQVSGSTAVYKCISLQHQLAIQKSKILDFKKSWYNLTYVRTYVITAFYVCRIIKIVIKNHYYC